MLRDDGLDVDFDIFVWVVVAWIVSFLAELYCALLEEEWAVDFWEKEVEKGGGGEYPDG